MKKSFFVFLLICFIAGSNAYAQENFFHSLIDECVSLLGMPVPATGFQGIGRFRIFGQDTDRYLRGDNNTVLYTQNDLIVYSNFGYYHPDRDRAETFYSFFQELLESTNWEHSFSYERNEIYRKNGVYAGILKPIVLRDDGSYSTMISFSRNRDFFSH